MPADRSRKLGARAPWRDPVVVALAAVLAIIGVQLTQHDDPARTVAAGAPFALALVTYLVVVRAPLAATLRLFAGTQVALAAATLAAFARAWPAGADDPAGFYRVKVLVTTAAGDHNTVGGLLLVGVVATAALAVTDRRWWGGTLLTTAGVIASLSRGAALVLLLVGAGAWAVRPHRRVAGAVTAAGAVATAAVSGLAAGLGAAPPAAAGASAGMLGASVTGRFDLIVRGVETALREPWTGVGVGRFVQAAGDLPFPNLHAHNAAAHLGAELGLVGATAAFVLPVVLLVRAWRAPPGPVRDVALVGGAALVAHAQIDVLAGLWSYEVSLAVLLGAVVPRSGASTGER